MEEARRREQREDWNSAIDLVNRVLAKKPGGGLQSLAARKLPYLETRRDAQAKYEASDFASAAQLYEKAVELDPFATQAAFQCVNSYLLNDKLPEALRLLKAIRVRGTSDSIEKANAMLAQLAVVYPDAGAELKAAIPQPPAIEEVFSGIRFGKPDYDAGNRYVQSSPVDLTRWIKDVTAANPPSGPSLVITPEQTAVLTQVLKGILHLEVVPSSETRDLTIRRIGSKDQEYGFVQLEGPQGETPVIFNNKTIAQQVPAKFPLPVGKYEIRYVKDDQVLNQLTVEVKALSNQIITVKQ